MDVRDDDPEAAILVLDAVAQKAKLGGYAWFEMFVLHWKLQTLLHGSQNPEAALPLAARCTVAMQKPVFANFPQRVCLHEDLISAYHQIDPLGNADLIENALNYMEREISPGAECALCFLGLKADFKCTISAPDCIEVAFEALRVCDEANDEFHRVQALAQICQTTTIFAPEYAREHLSMIALDALESARRRNYDEYLHELMMWFALGLLYANDQNAEKTFQLAIDTRKRYGSAAKAGYYLAAEMVYIENEDLEGALENLNTELAEIENKGEVFREVTRRLAKCHLLRELDKDWREDAAKLEAKARELKDSSWVMGALAELNS